MNGMMILESIRGIEKEERFKMESNANKRKVG